MCIHNIFSFDSLATSKIIFRIEIGIGSDWKGGVSFLEMSSLAHMITL